MTNRSNLRLTNELKLRFNQSNNSILHQFINSFLVPGHTLSNFSTENFSLFTPFSSTSIHPHNHQYSSNHPDSFHTTIYERQRVSVASEAKLYIILLYIILLYIILLYIILLYIILLYIILLYIILLYIILLYIILLYIILLYIILLYIILLYIILLYIILLYIILLYISLLYIRLLYILASNIFLGSNRFAGILQIALDL